ncbi:MBL fold metallo-hydrolase [Pseudobacteriovorax antillogorgiicola]|uniref:L-ascorbate metabolism protein UlaG, beta-lactamase superfamily n=1 Tax=Pseudobacteriovorax antillogorgiicola TaxID=1513793 RepID=A0A1Y6CIV9_9BACT|nr:MBL fold metallo-hydrolase [Pseudobacteriovorax antillogorgiicola]TCS48265.1 L-ascorbate metabolism protein UlaG (beta-lactamase superfamily) [Pseudobacteriovorax antillogorgiicola]SMF57121.1 L-ascorbate metabolism protein UlaG, beta-lactamase superfamily [Pseudobacteriovorax antillogorgiicola]
MGRRCISKNTVIKLVKTISVAAVAATLLTTVSNASQAMKIHWFGTSNIVIDDGENAIAFDPFFSRPGLWDLFSLSTLKPDPEVIEHWLSKSPISKIKGVFVSHSHYDHILDLVPLAKKFSSQVFVDDNGRTIAMFQGYQENLIKIQKVNEIYSVGKFSVEVLRSGHAPHLWGKVFMSGKIKSPFPREASFLDYKNQDCFSYLIRHPQLTILFAPSSFEDVERKNVTVDLIIQGIAARKSSESLLKNLVIPYRPKAVMPVHHDNFFRRLDAGQEVPSGVALDEFIQTTKQLAPEVVVIQPQYGKPIEIGALNKLRH